MISEQTRPAKALSRSAVESSGRSGAHLAVSSPLLDQPVAPSPPPAPEPPRSTGIIAPRPAAPAAVVAPRATKSPMARRSRGPRPLRAARRLGWRSPMTVAVLASTFVVSLLCFYVAAYARVTAEGFALSQLRNDLRAAQQEEEALRARISRLRMPGVIEQRAEALGMTLAAPRGSHVLQEAPAGATTRQTGGN